MATKQSSSDGFHLKFTIGKALWTELFRVGLPYRVAEGQFDLLQNLRAGVRQLELRQRVRGLLEDRSVPPLVLRGGEAARQLWAARKEQVFERLKEVVSVQGDWKVEIDREGSDFLYANQRFGIEAHVKAVATGKLYLLRENIELPFTIEKRIGAQAALADIRYDRQKAALVGDLSGVQIDLGENLIFEVLSRGLERLAQDRLASVSPVTILKREQVEEMVGPMGGPLRLKLGVEDVGIDVSDDELTLKVKFGFTQLQLEG